MPKYPDGTFNQQKYIADFVRENYDEIKMRLPKGSKDLLKAMAQARKISVNKLITVALQEHYGIDLGCDDL